MRNAALIAVLFDSVPPLVKTTSDGSQPSKCRNPLSREVDRRAHLFSKPITARWIAPKFFQIQHHLLDYGRIGPRGGVVIEINNLIGFNHDCYRLQQLLFHARFSAGVFGSVVRVSKV